jgi:hypothetical protein
VIGLVQCVARKRAGVHRAEDLYCSPWFRKARAYAEASCDRRFILSGKHGLLAPGAVISRYNVTLNRMSAEAWRAWGARVAKQLRRVCRAGDRVVVLAGARYREHVLPALRARGCRVEVPMRGLGIGRQLRWLGRASSSARGRGSER